jgi:hypothetical protein
MPPDDFHRQIDAIVDASLSPQFTQMVIARARLEEHAAQPGWLMLFGTAGATVFLCLLGAQFWLQDHPVALDPTGLQSWCAFADANARIANP